MKESVDFER